MSEDHLYRAQSDRLQSQGRENLFLALVALFQECGELDAAARKTILQIGRFERADPSLVETILAKADTRFPTGWDDEHGRRHCFEQVTLALVWDEKITRRELDMLRRIGPACGVQESDLKDAIKTGYEARAKMRQIAAAAGANPDDLDPEAPNVDGFRLLCCMSLVDGKLDEAEKTALLEAAERMKLYVAEASAILREVQQAGKLTLPPRPKDRYECTRAIDAAAAVAAADGEVSPREEQVLQAIGKHWGCEREVEMALFDVKGRAEMLALLAATDPKNRGR